MMKKILTGALFLFLLFPPSHLMAQGSWNPSGMDPTSPRTILDSLDIPSVRANLSSPQYLWLYGKMWEYVNQPIPAGNTAILDRYVRSMMAREAAFVYLMDRKSVANSIQPLTQAERDTMLNRTIYLLESMNSDVDVGSGLTFYNPWQFRSKELIAYLVAYDLLKGAGITSQQLSAAKSKLLTFAANLYQKSMASYVFPLNLKFFTYQINNHNIMTASALGLAAVVFNNNSSTNANYQPLNWINAGLYNLDNTLWIENGTYPRVSEPDTMAGYAESPHYLRYGFENAFPFIRAMQNFLPDGYYPATFNSNTRSIRHPWYDPRYDRLYDWMNRIRMPDGSVPPIHDSYLAFGTRITALSGNPGFNWPNPGFTANDPIYRAQFIATNIPEGTVGGDLFQPLTEAGSLVFRSAWDTNAIYLHCIGKHGIALTGAKAHHQGDATSFCMAAYDELLTVDPGYPGSSQASLVNKATDHSLVLVNGSGPQPPTGEAVSVSTNTSYIENFFDTPLLDYGEVRSSYQGADIIRKILFLRDKYFLMSDFVTASSTKNFTFQLHGNGLAGSAPDQPTGAFYPDFGNQSGIYRRKSVFLKTRISAPGAAPAFSFDTDSLAIGSGFRKYSRMLAQKNSVTGTVFLTTLYPYTSSAPQILPSVQNSLVTSARVETSDYRDIAFVSLSGTMQTVPADSSGMGKIIRGNGKISLYSETIAGKFSVAFMQYGDSLAAGTQTIIKTQSRANVAWTMSDSMFFTCHISATGWLRLCAEHPLQLLSGDATSLSYDTLRKTMVIQVAAPGILRFGREDLTWVWTGSVSQNWHDPLNWQMKDHSEIHGVPGDKNHVLIPAGTLFTPKVQSAEPATCNNLTIEPDALLTVDALKFLTIYGVLTIKP